MQLIKKYFPYLLVLFFVILYIHNLSRSVYGGDVGDFVTTAAIGGVAHAPGYPLFILLGFILIHLLPFFTPAFAMGLISAISGALGVGICYLVVKRLTNNPLSSAIAAITLGVSYLYWFYAEIAEVFALNSFFILLLFLLAILFDQTRKKKYLLYFSFVFGLAAITHQTVALFVPSFALLLLPGFIKMKHKIISVLQGLILFASCFLFYIYVFIASSHHPVINWDNVHDLSSFLRLLLRQDYGTFKAGVFAGPAFSQRLVILKSYLFSFVSQLTIPVLVISCYGIWDMFKKKKLYVLAFVLAFVISGPFFVGYAGFPLQGSFYFGIYERFFTMSTLSIFFLFGYGINQFAKLFVKLFDRPVYFLLIQCVFLLIPLQLFIFNMQKTDLSNVWTGDQLSKDFLTPLPKDTLLLIGGDTALFNTWYVHYALHVRPDVSLVNISLASMDPVVTKEEKAVQKQNPHLNGNELVAKTILSLSKKRPVFSYDQIQAPGKTDLKWVPTGLLYRLYPTDPKLSEKDFLKTISQMLAQVHFPLSQDKEYNNLTIAEIPELYSKPLWAIGNYLLNTYKDPEAALTYYEKSIQINPTYENAYITRALIYLTSKTNCALAVNNLEMAQKLAPYDPLSYFLLFTSYNECYHDKAKSDAVIKSFTNEFHEDFYKQLAKTLNQFKAQ